MTNSPRANKATSKAVNKTASKAAPAIGGDDEREEASDEPQEPDEPQESDESVDPAGTEGASDGEGLLPVVADLEADSAPRARARRGRAAGALTRVPSDPDLVSPGVPRDPVNRIMTEIRRYPRLSEDEERRLGKAVREAGDMDAARRLVVHNLRLVMSIANHYRRAWANILDLFQEGSVGLMEAVKRWEPSLGPRFGSYAAYWIRAYLLKFLMTNSRLIHVGNTRAGRKLFFRLEKERQKLLAAGFDPTPKLLAAKLDVSEHDLEEVGRHLDSREVSFDPRGTSDADEGYSLSERIPLEQASPEDSAATAEMSGNLHQVMGEFVDSLTDERERAVWKEHLAAEDPLSLGEIGARFGVSKQRMGQIADKLKKQFRDRVESRMGTAIRTDWLGGESD